MSKSMINELCLWSDLQSLATRTTEADIGFKPKLARSILQTACLLHKWYRNQTTTTKALENLLMSQQLSKIKLRDNNSIASGLNNKSIAGIDDLELLEQTDIGGEDGDDSDNENNIDEHETENNNEDDDEPDNHEDHENDHDDYLDSEIDPNELHTQLIGFSPFNFPGL